MSFERVEWRKKYHGPKKQSLMKSELCSMPKFIKDYMQLNPRIWKLQSNITECSIN